MIGTTITAAAPLDGCLALAICRALSSFSDYCRLEGASKWTRSLFF